MCLACQLFELVEALERMQQLRRLHHLPELIDCPHQLHYPSLLLGAVTPCTIGDLVDRHGLLAQVGADLVPVIARESPHGVLDVHEKPFGCFHNWR